MPTPEQLNESSAASVPEFETASDDVLLTQLMETGRIRVSGLSVSRLTHLLDTLGLDPSEALLYGDQVVVMCQKAVR
jgi:hypothetical protein